MEVILVCGYRRTGKDTLYQTLRDRSQTNLWIYQHPDRVKEGILGIGQSGDVQYVRVALADALKVEAHRVYGIPLDIADADKDRKQFQHYRSGEMVSARDIYIEWGAQRRAEDPNYWCKVAFDLATTPSPSITKETESESGNGSGSKSVFVVTESSSAMAESPKTDLSVFVVTESSPAMAESPKTDLSVFVVTDWRFGNEYDYVQANASAVTTCRIYRSDVSEPPMAIESEHQLDPFQTDILLISDTTDFASVTDRFPQYIDYIRTGKL